MVELIYLAAAIPFVIIVAVVVVLATVRYSISSTHLVVYILGFTIRKIAISEIRSVAYLPPEEGAGWKLFHHGGTVIVQAGVGEGRTFALSPRDAEGLAADLTAAVARQARREI